jgi:hypothetical protein
MDMLLSILIAKLSSALIGPISAKALVSLPENSVVHTG